MELLETSVKALEIVKLVTAEIPIPGLSTAVECALSIAKKAKEIKDTREDCRALAERAAALVIALYQQLKNGSSDMGVQVYITTFLQNLQAIENLMDRRLRPRKRDRALFALKRGQIADEIKTLTAKLEDSFRVFMIQAALAINQDMNTLTNGNLRMLQHIDDSARVGEVVLTDTREIRTGLSDLAHRVGGSAAFDGNFRLFARENLTLLEPIIDSYIPHHSTIQPRTGRVFRYRAVVQATGELSGTQVVVHAYPNHDDQGFVEAVKFAKQTYHPHMLAMLGYSRPGGPGEATYIVMEYYIPFLEYLSLLRGADIIRAYLKMMAETYTAVDHLELMELRQLHDIATYWDSSEKQCIRFDEVVFDHRHGGCIKWTWNPLTLDKTGPSAAIGIPTVQTSRMHIAENLRAVACARMETVVQHWLSLILSPMGVYDDFVPGHSWLEHWEHITDYPRYPLGVWVLLGRNRSDEGCNRSDEGCTDRSDEGCNRSTSPSPMFEVAVTMPSVPLVLSDSRQGHDFHQSLSMAEWFDVPESDLGEMCIEFELDTGGSQTRWKRYQFSSVPVNTTLLFQQRVHALDSLHAALWMVCLLPDPSIVGQYAHIGIATHRFYYTETTVTMNTHAAEQMVQPLWLFALQFDGGDGSAHDYNIPCAFWSSEKYPTSIPTDIIFSQTPQSEPIKSSMEAPLFTWAQALGDLVFTTQTRMATNILQLSEDELFAFRECHESHHSTSDANANHSDDYGGDDVATGDSTDEHDAGSLTSNTSHQALAMTATP